MANISVREVDKILADAKTALIPPEFSTGIAGAGDGACVAITPGNPDRCAQLSQAECKWVNREVKKKDSQNFARWFKDSPCPI